MTRCSIFKRSQEQSRGRFKNWSSSYENRSKMQFQSKQLTKMQGMTDLSWYLPHSITKALGISYWRQRRDIIEHLIKSSSSTSRMMNQKQRIRASRESLENTTLLYNGQYITARRQRRIRKKRKRKVREKRNIIEDQEDYQDEEEPYEEEEKQSELIKDESLLLDGSSALRNQLAQMDFDDSSMGHDVDLLSPLESPLPIKVELQSTHEMKKTQVPVLDLGRVKNRYPPLFKGESSLLNISKIEKKSEQHDHTDENILEALQEETKPKLPVLKSMMQVI